MKPALRPWTISSIAQIIHAMTHALQQPERKSRRWGIVGVLLLFAVGLAAWTLFPKADRRFLGRWSTSGGVIMTFDRWGIVHIEAQKRDWHLRWEVDGELLVLSGSEPKAARGALQNSLVEIAEKWSGRTILPEGRDEFDIINVSPNRIHLRYHGSWGIRS